MSVFISYARDDRPAVEVVRRDLERVRCEVWYDDELSGGQSWWSEVLRQIRACDLFVFVLSPSSLKSKACQSELNYALSLHRPLLAVMVSPVSVQLAPKPVADSHIVNYTERTAESALELGAAVTGRAAPPALPEPLPSEPPPPMSYLNPYREQIHTKELSYQQQGQLVFALENHLDDDDDRLVARQLLTELRQRRDIVEEIGRRIDELLSGATAGGSTREGSSATSTSTAATAATTTTSTSAGWHPDPSGRFLQRYWDGQVWTEHVVSAEGQRTDPLDGNTRSDASEAVSANTFLSAKASDASSAPNERSSGDPFESGPKIEAASNAAQTTGKPALTTGVYISLIILTVLFGLIGVIAGAINLKHPARKGQAQVLLWLGIGIIVVSLALLGG